MMRTTLSSHDRRAASEIQEALTPPTIGAGAIVPLHNGNTIRVHVLGDLSLVVSGLGCGELFVSSVVSFVSRFSGLVVLGGVRVDR